MLPLLLLLLSPTLSFIHKESILSFKIEFEDPLVTGDTYSQKRRVFSYPSFSSIITGILTDYQFGEVYKCTDSSTNKNPVSCNFIELESTTDDQYKEYVQDYYKSRFNKGSALKQCDQYFSEQSCASFNNQTISLSLSQRSKNKESNNVIYGFNGNLGYLGQGSLVIKSLYMPERLIWAFFIFVIAGILWVLYDIVVMERKKMKTKQRIKQLEKTN